MKPVSANKLTCFPAKGIRATLLTVLAVLAFALMGLASLTPAIAYADPESDEAANSWRFNEGVLLSSEQGACPDPAVMTLSAVTNPNGYTVFDDFDIFENGYCSGEGAYRGIDVSVWNGTLDWAAIKEAGVDFAIIRCGYGMDQEDQDDAQWLNNVQGCIENNIPFGVYLYSYATNTTRATSEAEHVLRLLDEAGISPSDLALPVYYDMEDTSTLDSDFAALATTFCGLIEAAGYEAGVYSSLSWFESYLTDECFSQWPKWVAAWNASVGLNSSLFADFTTSGDMWQFSDYGALSGVSGRFDLNYTYRDIHKNDDATTPCEHSRETTVTPASFSNPGTISESCATCGTVTESTIAQVATPTLSASKLTYTGSKRTPTVTVKDVSGNELTRGTDYTLSYSSSSRSKVGVYTIKVTLMGNYTGSKSLTYCIVPAAPSSVRAVLYGHDDVKVTWSKSTGASGYTVYYKKSSASSYTKLGTTTGTSYKKANLTDGVKYTFKIVPYYKTADVKYTSTKSRTASVTTLKKVATPTVSKASVYQVKVTASTLNVRSGPGTGYSITGSLSKNTRQYIISTKNGWGQLASGKGWISLDYASNTGTTSVVAKVSWSNISGESGYQVSRSTSKTGTNIVKTVSGSSVKFTTVSATKGKTYYYKVRAYKVVDGVKIYGPWSNVKAYKRS